MASATVLHRGRPQLSHGGQALAVWRACESPQRERRHADECRQSLCAVALQNAGEVLQRQPRGDRLLPRDRPGSQHEPQLGLVERIAGLVVVEEVREGDGARAAIRGGIGAGIDSARARSARLSLLSLQRERTIFRCVHRRQPHAGGSDGSRGKGYEQQPHRWRPRPTGALRSSRKLPY